MSAVTTTPEEDAMSLVERPQSTNVPSVEHRTVAPAPAPEVTRDLGWLVTLLSAVATLLGSWMLFPKDADGMWAGYWVSGCATVAILGVMWLRTTLPALPAVAAIVAASGVLVLLGAVRDYSTTISVVMVAGGAGMAVGAVMQTVRRGARGSGA